LKFAPRQPYHDSPPNTPAKGTDGGERIPFTGRSEDFSWLTDAALRAAADNSDNVFGAVLGLLDGCHPAAWPTISEARGPSYAQLRAVADAMAMTPEQAGDWVLLAESVPLAERHVLYVLGALTEAAA